MAVKPTYLIGVRFKFNGRLPTDAEGNVCWIYEDVLWADDQTQYPLFRKCRVTTSDADTFAGCTVEHEKAKPPMGERLEYGRVRYVSMPCRCVYVVAVALFQHELGTKKLQLVRMEKLAKDKNGDFTVGPFTVDFKRPKTMRKEDVDGCVSIASGTRKVVLDEEYADHGHEGSGGGGGDKWDHVARVHDREFTITYTP
jgi:hypothetical protein